MKPQSAKGKGRRLQQLVCRDLAASGEQFGLEEGDFMSRSMGANGEDIIFTPAAIRVYGDLRVECKNVESLNVYTTFLEHAGKYPKATPVLVHKKNHKPPLVTITLTHYLNLLTRSALLGNDNEGRAKAKPNTKTKPETRGLVAGHRNVPEHSLDNRNGPSDGLLTDHWRSGSAEQDRANGHVYVYRLHGGRGKGSEGLTTRIRSGVLHSAAPKAHRLQRPNPTSGEHSR